MIKSEKVPRSTLPPRRALAFAQERRKAFGARAVGSFLPGLTRKAFEKYGFSAATLVTDWAAIVGGELGAYTAPERLKWPRGPGYGEAEAPIAPTRRHGATLIVRVDEGRGLEVEFAGRQIIERINAYFGYAAVGELRILQAPIVRHTAPAGHAERRPAIAHAGAGPELDGIGNAALRAALARLGEGIRLGRPG